MTAYSKTMAGRMVAVDQQSTLEPALKDFLKCVDGKTLPEQLVAQWRDGPDALRLLHELERRGLIEVRAARWRNSSANSVDGSPLASSFESSFESAFESSFESCFESCFESPVTPSDAGNRPQAQARAPDLAHPPFEAPTAPAPLDTPAARRSAVDRTAAELDAIKDHMSTFILTHLPQHAITVLKEIEDVDSYDRLMLMLTAYASMAHQAGRAGLVHIKSLRALLEPGFELGHC